MIKLIGLNLLPYREIARQEKQKEFSRLMVLALVAGLGLAFLSYILIGQMISNQDSRNELLTTNIAQLDQQIKKVEALKETKRSFMARKKKIEELQNERFKAAMVFNDLNTLMPDGTYLKTMNSIGGNNYSLTGQAISDNQVALLMRSLPSSGLLGSPELVGIRTNGDSQAFELKTQLVNHVDDNKAE